MLRAHGHVHALDRHRDDRSVQCEWPPDNGAGLFIVVSAPIIRATIDPAVDCLLDPTLRAQFTQWMVCVRKARGPAGLRNGGKELKKSLSARVSGL